ncbi:CLUMA_CG009858, isoform A [Clunio marinus]|uniref:CLUMA_CG009858, isoform A n=1 Tax=Clunio marinus TaxID=568069 RepID=A0A1J1I9M8_9DIPT|nr:CLUMA_CG009858, isoform A [Clunio marinus]
MFLIIPLVTKQFYRVVHYTYNQYLPNIPYNNKMKSFIGISSSAVGLFSFNIEGVRDRHGIVIDFYDEIRLR